MLLPYSLPQYITKVTVKPTVDGAPANSYLDGELILDPSFFKLPQDYQYFIICHEAGHIALQTQSEDLADAFGFNLYVKSGRSLKALVGALADVLSFTSNEHLLRTKKMLNRCLNYDLNHNNNKMVLSIKPNQNSLFGFTPLKNLQEAFERRQDRKDEKAQAKANLIQAKADAKIIKAQNGAGGGFMENASGLMNQYGNMVGNVAGKMFGGGEQAVTEPETQPSFFEKNKIVIIVLGVALVGAVVYFVTKK